MDRTLIDYRGAPVEQGTRVAYNLSGNVVTGTVERITNTAVHIQVDPSYKRLSYSGMSKLKTRYGQPMITTLVVLDPPVKEII
jgi:hypothetical protein